MINARSEEAATKSAFRVPWRRQRCLAPCTGFHEWKSVGDRDSRRLKKQPHYIRRKDERVFAFPGLWDRWHGPDGETVESYSILTTEPNDLVRPLHDRKPVIVPRERYGLWLDPNMQDVERLRFLFQPFPNQDLVVSPVSARVNSPAHNDAECLREIA